MRKLLFLLSAVGIAGLSSCGTEPPEEPEKVHDTSLAGTKGEGWSIVDFEGYNEMYELEFTENVEGETALYITLRGRSFIFGLKEIETEGSE